VYKKAPRRHHATAELPEIWLSTCHCKALAPLER